MKAKKYHWQPELSISIIYWSVTLMILFYSLTLSLENTRPYWKSNLVLLFFFFMAIIGFLRWFFVKETYLLVYYSRFWKRDRFYYQGIQKICSLPNGIELTYKNKTHHFLMRKKTRDNLLRELEKHVPADLFSQQSAPSED
ncbi:EbsA family protein [Enterococcus massiliensis]|uniref:EbsA family protein n=1 Tax=Enterococcus massiliensis TaxID=1640685 RepID=UPI00065DD401|nr:EbsA family protein [Enterococcus massiliensis]